MSFSLGMPLPGNISISNSVAQTLAQINKVTSNKQDPSTMSAALSGLQGSPYYSLFQQIGQNLVGATNGFNPMQFLSLFANMLGESDGEDDLGLGLGLDGDTSGPAGSFSADGGDNPLAGLGEDPAQLLAILMMMMGGNGGALGGGLGGGMGGGLGGFGGIPSGAVGMSSQNLAQDLARIDQSMLNATNLMATMGMQGQGSTYSSLMNAAQGLSIVQNGPANLFGNNLGQLGLPQDLFA